MATEGNIHGRDRDPFDITGMSIGAHKAVTHLSDTEIMPLEHGPRDDGQDVFQLRTRRADMALQIQVEGKLDRHTGHYLVDVVNQLTMVGDTVTFDLTLVAHMDSDGAEAVSRAASIVASKESMTALQVDNAKFGRLLQQCGLLGEGATTSERQARA